jgi:hypothetical protein
MPDICSNHNCNRRITPGVRIVQVARGYWYEGAITPTLKILESEWHENCYEGELRFQSLPYTCHSCNQEIRHGDYVSYVVVGYAPDESYMRAESRGYQMAHIEHARCPRR